MNYGIKVSKPGHNVVTATEENLILSSERENLKIALEGETDEWTANEGEERTVAIPHNLGYVPLFLTWNYVYYSPEEGYQRGDTSYEGGPRWGAIQDIYVDSSKLYVNQYFFNVDDPNDMYLFKPVKYIIFKVQI